MRIVSVLALIAITATAWAGPDEPCRVGAQLHLQKGPADETYLRHLRAFVEEGMADYAMILAYSLDREDRESVARYFEEHDVPFLVQQNPDPKEWRYTPEELARIREIAPNTFLGLHWGELDSTRLKPEDYLPPDVYANPTRATIKAALLERVRMLTSGVHDGFGVPFAHSSAVLYHHIFAEAGVDILCSEVGENIPNVNMMIASNRGVARAYGRPWMIDHSTWWSPRGNVGEQVSPREGHTPWCFFTNLLGAAMSGADYVQLEVDWAAYPQDSLFKAGTGKPEPLLPWGQALKTLRSMAQAIGPRGDTLTPFAVLLGHENGWPGVGWRVGDVRATGLYDGIRHGYMQTRDADLSLKILDVFYPGFERCGWDPEYPGFLAESPFGVLDIVPDNLTADKYARYRVLVALGYHQMNEPLREALKEYVDGGGILICADTMFLDETEQLVPASIAEPLIGCTYDAAPDSLVHLKQPKSELSAIEGLAAAGTRDEWGEHWIHPVEITHGEVVATIGGQPYIIQNRIGEGRVYFIAALNGVGSDSQRRGPEPFLYSSIFYYFLHTLEDHIGDGIEFGPWNGLEHIYNDRPDGTAMLLVMNHGDSDYRRDAVMKNPAGFTRCRAVARGTWQGFASGETISLKNVGETLTWSFDVVPKGFVLFEFS